MAEENWFFPVADYGTKQGLNDSGLETFLDRPLDSLVRETIQNSLDAKSDDTDEPVRVQFEFFKRPVSDIPGFRNLAGEYIPKALRSWEDDSKEYEYLQKVADLLSSSDDIHILRIADFNTTGLDDRNWDALVTETGVSSKSNTQAAGSKGIGKNAPFAASDIRTVVYNTKTKTYEKSIGVTVGVSFVEQDGIGVSQSRGYLGSSHNNPFNHQYSFLKNRDEVGTDVFVVGVKQEYVNSQKAIILNVLEHFMLAIFHGELVVEVDDVLIDKSLVKSNIETLLPVVLDEDSEFDRLRSVLAYHSVLTHTDTKCIKLDESFVSTYPFIESVDDATFLLLPMDPKFATRKVLMARKSGMTIMWQSFRQGVYFTGIFQATGAALNTFLRQLESAEHDDWSPERAEGLQQQKLAKKFVRELKGFLGEHIRGLTEVDDNEVIDAYGLAELLPDEESVENDSQNDTDGSISPLVAGVTVKPPRKIKQQLTYTPDDPSVEGGDGGDGPGDGGRRRPLNNPPGPPSPNDNPPKGSPLPIFKEVHDAKIRPVELDYKNGEYALRILPDRGLLGVKIKVAVAGESGDYRLQVESADGNEAEVIDGDGIYITQLPAGVLSQIKIKVDARRRLRLKAVIYESK